MLLKGSLYLQGFGLNDRNGGFCVGALFMLFAFVKRVVYRVGLARARTGERYSGLSTWLG